MTGLRESILGVGGVFARTTSFMPRSPDGRPGRSPVARRLPTSSRNASISLRKGLSFLGGGAGEVLLAVFARIVFSRFSATFRRMVSKRVTPTKIRNLVTSQFPFWAAKSAA